MSVLFCVKRRRSEDCPAALSTHTKRARLTEESVFQLMGTSDSRDTLPPAFKSSILAPIAEGEDDADQAGNHNHRSRVFTALGGGDRYRLVARKRSQDVTIVDVLPRSQGSDCVTMNGVAMETAPVALEGAEGGLCTEDCVYDFYKASDDFDLDEGDVNLAMYSENYDLEFGSEDSWANIWRQGAENSDDSNSENNWRNDYPDADSFDSNDNSYTDDNSDLLSFYDDFDKNIF